jgi:hypothetical protein
MPKEFLGVQWVSNASYNFCFGQHGFYGHYSNTYIYNQLTAFLNMPYPFTARLLFFALACFVCSCKNRTEQPDRIYKKPVIVANPVLKSLSPEEALQTFYLPEGYRIELVASEPLIGEPVSLTWDGDGQMYVAQMRTYMQDADATNENAPWSRISLLEDSEWRWQSRQEFCFYRQHGAAPHCASAGQPGDYRRNL